VTRDVDLAAWRLRNQKLLTPDDATAADLVAWLGAVQSQDFPGAKWAVGQRGRGLTDAAVERAFNDGAILRTHVMRPTWHFTTAADIRWMLTLTGPRVHATLRSYCRNFGIDDAVMKKCRRIVERVLSGQSLERGAIGKALAAKGLSFASMPLSFVTIRLELDQVICSGPRVERKLTYALFDERVPAAPSLKRDEAIAELARRYFTSHGPATLRDFSWWSGLAQRDGKRGIEILRTALSSVEIDGHRLWHATASTPPPAMRNGLAHLLPNYDEYLVAFKDRGFIPGAVVPRAGAKPPRDVHPHHVIVNGRLAGSWKRLEGGADIDLYPGQSPDVQPLVSQAVRNYEAFLKG